MKFYFVNLFIALIMSICAQSAFAGEFDWYSLLSYFDTLSPIVHTALVILGGIVVVGTTVDTMVDDSIDKGFMKKLMEIPVVGAILKALARFSPFNYK